MIQPYPSARKDTDAVIRAVKQFMGRRKIREAYSDDAPQFDKAMQALKVPMDTSLAGKTKHNSLAERTSQFVLVATTNSVEVFRFYGWIRVTLGGTGLFPKTSKSHSSAVKWRICCKICLTFFSGTQALKACW